MWRRFLSDERGATAIEYALIASLIFLAAITAMYSFGSKASGMFSSIANTLTSSS